MLSNKSLYPLKKAFMLSKINKYNFYGSFFCKSYHKFSKGSKYGRGLVKINKKQTITGQINTKGYLDFNISIKLGSLWVTGEFVY